MKKNNNKGFTFIELVLYIGILSVFMVAVTSLVGTVVSSNRKMTNRKKIQNEAGETYDTISDMIMGATDVKILGSAYVATTSAGVTSYSPVSGVFIVPDDTDTKGSGGELMSAGVNAQRLGENVIREAKQKAAEIIRTANIKAEDREMEMPGQTLCSSLLIRHILCLH